MEGNYTKEGYVVYKCVYLQGLRTYPNSFTNSLMFCKSLIVISTYVLITTYPNSYFY